MRLWWLLLLVALSSLSVSAVEDETPQPLKKSEPQSLVLPILGESLSPDDSSPLSRSTLNDNVNDNDSEQCSVGLQEFPLKIDNDLTLRFLQASSAFQGVGQDSTGTVVWGASICLARFVADRHESVVTNKTTLELGCGCALPSLVAAKKGNAKRIVVTDLEHATLQQLDAVVQLNNLEGQLDLFQLDWKDSYENSDEKASHLVSDDGMNTLLQADVILGSDVIYHQRMGPPLAQTIHKYLSANKDAKAYMALRNTRTGVSSFWQEAMPRAGFVLVESISCDEYLKPGDNDLQTLNEANSHRFHGDHTIYVFQRGKDAGQDE